jgi:hypothetical protein
LKAELQNPAGDAGAYTFGPDDNLEFFIDKILVDFDEELAQDWSKIG